MEVRDLLGPSEHNYDAFLVARRALEDDPKGTTMASELIEAWEMAGYWQNRAYALEGVVSAARAYVDVAGRKGIGNQDSEYREALAALTLSFAALPQDKEGEAER